MSGVNFHKPFNNKHSNSNQSSSLSDVFDNPDDAAGLPVVSDSQLNVFNSNSGNSEYLVNNVFLNSFKTSSDVSKAHSYFVEELNNNNNYRIELTKNNSQPEDSFFKIFIKGRTEPAFYGSTDKCYMAAPLDDGILKAYINAIKDKGEEKHIIVDTCPNKDVANQLIAACEQSGATIKFPDGMLKNFGIDEPTVLRHRSKP